MVLFLGLGLKAMNLSKSVKSVGDIRKGESIKTCKKRALSEFFVLPLYLQLQLETIKIKKYGK